MISVICNVLPYYTPATGTYEIYTGLSQYEPGLSADWDAWSWPGERLLHEARSSADRDLPLPFWGRTPKKLLLASQPCRNADICLSDLCDGRGFLQTF